MKPFILDADCGLPKVIPWEDTHAANAYAN
jgi:hypothetical protein